MMDWGLGVHVNLHTTIPLIRLDFPAIRKQTRNKSMSGLGAQRASEQNVSNLGHSPFDLILGPDC